MKIFGRKKDRLPDTAIFATIEVAPTGEGARWDPLDAERRLLGNLTVPRRAVDALELLTADPAVPLVEQDWIDAKLEDLVARGMAARIEGARATESMMDAIDRVLPLHPEKHALTAAAFDGSWAGRLDGSAFYYMTPAGLAFLTGS